MMHQPLRTLVLACGLLAAPLAGNAFYIYVHGIVTEYFTGDAMKGVQIRLVKDSVDRETVFTTANGKYELYLERGYDYQIWFHRSDLVTKYVHIDAQDIPLFPDVPFFDMDVQMTMFTWLNGYDFSLFNAPVGMAEYKHSVRNLNWNIEYTSKVRQLIDRFMIHYERELIGRVRDKNTTLDRRRRKTVVF